MHKDHDKTIIKEKWATSVAELKVQDELYSRSVGNVDLWYCKDCKKHFIHDWYLDKENDLSEGQTLKWKLKT